MQLREYQTAAVAACWEYVSKHKGNPCIVLPTGAGKSLVLAQLTHDVAATWGGRVIILAHVKELLEQNAEKLKAIAPDLNVGIYSAGLKRRERKSQVLVAGIQSVYNKACDFAPFDVIIVDEAHRLPPDGEGMYQKFLSDVKLIRPQARLIGLTATPYRMATGWLCGPDNLLTEVCYEVGVKELILQGYLSPLISKEPIAVNTKGLHVRGGEFIAAEADALMADVVKPACAEIVTRTENRRSVIIFCQNVEHAFGVEVLLRDAGLQCAVITGDTKPKERSETIEKFKRCELKYLVNVNVLTTGFDAPNVDCVCLLRPTMSPGLYYQMVGRGFRIAPGKENCLVLDFAGNLKSHGPVDQIEPKPKDIDGGGDDAPAKTCPECDTVCHAGFSACPDCGYEFPDRTLPKHGTTAEAAPVTSLEVITETYDVIETSYHVHQKRNAPPDSPRTMRVGYRINNVRWIDEWVCVEHEGYARSKAEAWWRARSNDRFPESASLACDIAWGGGLAETLQITVEKKAGEKFPRIVFAKIGPKPEGVTREDGDGFDFPIPDSSDLEPVDYAQLNWDELPF